MRLCVENAFNNFRMKYFFIKSVFLLLCIGNLNSQYSTPYNNFYVAMGTSVSSYVGGYFGNAYQLRVLSDYYDDYYKSISAFNSSGIVNAKTPEVYETTGVLIYYL